MDRYTINKEVYGTEDGAYSDSLDSSSSKNLDTNSSNSKFDNEIPISNSEKSKTSDSMRKTIEESLDKIRPYLNMEGGDVEFVDYDDKDKIVKVRLQGACSHCAISSVTLKMGVEKTLLEDIPDLKGVVQVE